MQRYDDTLYPPMSAASPRVRTTFATLAQETKMGRRRKRVHQLDQLHCTPRLWELQWANQMLAQILEIRETRVAALRREIESGHYSVKAEQVAEKIMEEQLLELF
jgi:flagellar biosynthesis anti-sigma factor FlgM